MLDNGVYLPPPSLKPLFSTAHSEAAGIQQTIAGEASIRGGSPRLGRRRRHPIFGYSRLSGNHNSHYTTGRAALWPRQMVGYGLQPDLPRACFIMSAGNCLEHLVRRNALEEADKISPH
jgi:hypothetical protein